MIQYSKRWPLAWAKNGARLWGRGNIPGLTGAIFCPGQRASFRVLYHIVEYYILILYIFYTFQIVFYRFYILFYILYILIYIIYVKIYIYIYVYIIFNFTYFPYITVRDSANWR